MPELGEPQQGVDRDVGERAVEAESAELRKRGEERLERGIGERELDRVLVLVVIDRVVADDEILEKAEEADGAEEAVLALQRRERGPIDVHEKSVQCRAGLNNSIGGTCSKPHTVPAELARDAAVLVAPRVAQPFVDGVNRQAQAARDRLGVMPAHHQAQRLLLLFSEGQNGFFHAAAHGDHA
mgnify:CR=1 FL=1